MKYNGVNIAYYIIESKQNVFHTVTPHYSLLCFGHELTNQLCESFHVAEKINKFPLLHAFKMSNGKKGFEFRFVQKRALSGEESPPMTVDLFKYDVSKLQPPHQPSPWMMDPIKSDVDSKSPELCYVFFRLYFFFLLVYFFLSWATPAAV